VGLGSPKSGVTVNFAVMQGSGLLSAASAVTNGSGYASVTLTLTNFTAAVQVSACVAPGNNPCQIIAGNPVAASMVNLQAVGGGGQVVTGLGLQPMTVRVTDFSTPPNGVLGESVLFQSAVLRPVDNGLTQTADDPSATPTILSESQISVQRRQWPGNFRSIGWDFYGTAGGRDPGFGRGHRHAAGANGNIPRWHWR
jgi:hypothetical protein